MNLWSVFVTGLFAGGASCVAVQGGLLAGVVARRSGESADGQSGAVSGPARKGKALVGATAGSPTRARSARSGQGSTAASRRVSSGARSSSAARSSSVARSGASSKVARAAAPSRFDDVVPVGGFLAGKLVSHALFGALLGLLGEAVQIGFGTRSLMQIVAGVLMLLMAANLLGARGLQRLVPSAPPGVVRLVRRTARSEAAFAPAILGFMTVLIPCGVTLSVMFLAIASGSPILGAMGMAIFVLGTSPLFVALGFAVRRSSGFMRGRLTKLAAAAVIVAGVLSINSGLVLRGSPVTLQSLWSDDRVSSLDSSATASAAKAVPGPRPASPDSGAAAAAVSPDGVQQLVIDVRDSSYSPARLKASAGIPTVLTLRTNGTQGCTRGFVIPSMRVQKVLPTTGETTIDLGTLQPGRLNYTCSMGMYSGSVDVT